MTVSRAALSAAGPAVALDRAPDRLGLHLLLLLGLLLVFVAAVGSMRRAWRNRAERQEEDLPELPVPPAEPGTVFAAPLRGMYLGTVDAGHWLEWIAARGLGGRAGGYVSVYETGVRVDRPGEAFWIPREAVRGARLERAHAGKVSAPGRLIVIAWSFGGHELETGFRGEDRARQPKVVRAVHDLIGPPPAHLAPGDVTSPHAVPRIRPRIRPRAVAPGPGPVGRSGQRPGSGQPTEEMPAIRTGPRLRSRGERAQARGERAVPADRRLYAERWRSDQRLPDRRHQDEGHPDPRRSDPRHPERRHPDQWPADPESDPGWVDPEQLDQSDPGWSSVDPLTSPLGEVNRLKEDR
ncbi:hypothetical protein CcI156_16985 [Frankia sp. CcI156]|uniref:PH domain-containing protein n=1 Tax=Frankia casuarinae (strain DSM 45818 / CECT 9043 / HFP020203 / CcI3) TaxID=106370 RepID=Q2J835_FRACC|nr:MULTISPECIES: hypothetical protein [Frankia]ABD12557.1 hypothetical protein Francci3_3200 [Frankia casuarinae]ETA01060.1 hypothetical protein CcI6DRAFT_03499 [Frankia sp. CcI6]EYT90567.1 hypothetical protein ThrDRAFT_03815 [Frankia casuarinae]KDA42136.1 hypothetical protein BMG523Draft_03044 [Frankia sp. BMG5.23]KFB03653.1 hypothetical protein ALLO2DRAFT_03575 [Frankia sp. Allo2]